MDKDNQMNEEFEQRELRIWKKLLCKIEQMANRSHLEVMVKGEPEQVELTPKFIYELATTLEKIHKGIAALTNNDGEDSITALSRAIERSANVIGNDDGQEEHN